MSSSRTILGADLALVLAAVTLTAMPSGREPARAAVIDTVRPTLAPTIDVVAIDLGSERFRFLAPRAPAATAYRWDFGDGTHDTTREAAVEHDFGDRPQTSAHSEFAVNVTTVGPVIARGTTTVALLNRYLRDKAGGVLRPELRLGPAQLTGGVWRAPFRVVNHEPEVLALETAVDLEQTACEGVDPPPARVDLRQLLGVRALPAGVTTGTLQLRASDLHPGACYLSFTVRGRSAAQPAQTRFGFEVASRYRVVAITDPAEKAALSRARAARSAGGAISEAELRVYAGQHVR